ncbi:hypothetical protein Fcan01_16553 [Folsomia candida]|uniref:Uncharacterized protein n=1 Tax=Folsomia candida TaxID=158441 RepID=A0A226DUM3_FOLCA|nr:hypothetical protein Fcan01_16553 [Folsomia candida]
MGTLFKFCVYIVSFAASLSKSLGMSNATPNTNTLPSAYNVSYLNDLLNQFSNCLIHFINYKHLDIHQPEIPIVLEDPGYNIERLEDNLTRRQKDSFRWKCVFHGFLFPEMPTTVHYASQFECPHYYKEYWTGPISGREAGFSNLFRHRDFWIYFTDRKFFTNWATWARGIERVQGSKAQSYTGIVYISKSTQLPEWYISCRTCHPKKFTFHQHIPTDQTTIVESFYKIATTFHPDNKFQISDVFSEVPVHSMKTEQLQNSTKYQQMLPRTNDLASIGSYKFLTCDGLLQGELSGPKFGNLVSAYGMEAWVALLVLGFVSAIILKFIHSSGKVIVLSDTLLLALALLLEQGINIPTFRNKLLSSTCILAPWLLMFVVLSNGYRGSNTIRCEARAQYTLLDGIVSCNKSAMVVYGSDINEYEAKLKFLRPKSNIAKGKDELFKEELGWLVSYSLDAKLED